MGTTKKSKKDISQVNIQDSGQVLKEALYKKALGYTVQEVCEEYINQDQNLVLSKRKIINKEIPPDIPAVKTLIELIGVQDDYKNYSDQELEDEKNRLLQSLKEQDEKE